MNRGDAILRVADITRPIDFDLSRPLEVEVGCGKGRFLTARAKAHPDCDFLGIERMLERVRLFDGKCRREGIANAKVLRLKALYTFHYLLPAHHARRVYVFFPDPWHKTRHHKRRMVKDSFAELAARALAPGGLWRLATDWADYADQMREVLDAEPTLEGGQVERWDERPVTRFERKGRDVGRDIVDFCYRRSDRG